ncbi:cyclin-T1-3-like isoform X2 [Impatiens glandulifera]|uniref:cyclin-T1-3-like isoform X2 n=1 Tax=Impatiens glandulifera TaxID=253017 RepID=UPI001FB0845F|nr:cyclin-T1-3-like isoform X2 [Impatiens glandulifera]
MSRIYTHHSEGGSLPGGGGKMISYKRGYGAIDPVDSSNCYDFNQSQSRNYNNNNHNENWRKLGNHAHVDNHLNRDSSAPFLKRRKFSASSCEGSRRDNHPNTYNHVQSMSNQSVETRFCPNGILARESSSILPAHTIFDGNGRSYVTNKPDLPKLEDVDTGMVFMSRGEIERCSPSRKDGIDAVHEMHLRYSYSIFLQNLGMQLDLPQTTIGTAIILCHRFFLRRSHACHDRFLIATAAIFLVSKSEDTPRPLNNVLRLSSEILHKQDFAYLSYRFPIDWFEKYKERVFEAEHLILTTLNFELHVNHPYAPLTSILNKFGLGQVLENFALSLISEGVYTR